MSDSEKNVFQEVFCNFANDMSKKRALELCSSHLQGSWSSLTEDHFDLNIIGAGFVNRLFVCHNKKTNEKVIVRLYGGKTIKNLDELIFRHIGIEGEVLIFHMMDVNGIGPGLLGVFDGGRIEEYLEGAHTLSDNDCKNNGIVASLAHKLAKMHSIEVPLKKTPKNIMSIIQGHFKKYLEPLNQLMVKERRFESSLQEEDSVVFSSTYNWMSIIDWFVNTLPKIKSRVVFSHNDMNRFNFMVLPDKSVTFLDFEMAGYNHRAYDIGSHFKHRQIDISKFANGGSPFDTGIAYPTEEERRFFIREYLKVATKSYDSVDESIDNEDHLLLEAEFYAGVYQLFFGAYVLSTVECEHMAFPVHSGVMFAGFLRDIEDRKKNVIDLLHRFPELSLE